MRLFNIKNVLIVGKYNLEYEIFIQTHKKLIFIRYFVVSKCYQIDNTFEN